MSKEIIADSNQGLRQQVKFGQTLVQTTHAAFAFTAMSRSNWMQILQSGIGHFLFFPAFAGLAIFRAGLYGYDLIQSKNKNLGKVSSFLREALSATVVTTAVVFSFFAGTILAMLSPLLFVGILGFNALFNIGMTIYSGVRWANSKNLIERENYNSIF